MKKLSLEGIENSKNEIIERLIKQSIQGGNLTKWCNEQTETVCNHLTKWCNEQTETVCNHSK